EALPDSNADDHTPVPHLGHTSETFGGKQEDPRGNLTSMARNFREGIKNGIAVDEDDRDDSLAPR
ncbi:hypothetical protein HAX54_014255, partial [Datura stramonium]|nr:hypothetical protein [Datura stramonium]